MAKHADPTDGVEGTEPESGSLNSDGPTEETEPESPDAQTVSHDGPDTVDEVQQLPGNPARLALRVGACLLAAVSALAGWLGFKVYELRQVDHQRESYVQAARQGALNLTTIDWERADADVQRVLESAAGTFRDDFASRAPAFVEVVKKLQSKSVGTVGEAGLETMTDTDAQVLVTMSVMTELPNQPREQPRSWRLRISLQREGDRDVKVSNVVFVP